MKRFHLTQCNSFQVFQSKDEISSFTASLNLLIVDDILIQLHLTNGFTD